MLRHESARPEDRTAPAPTPALWRLLALIRRPLPLGELRPAAAAAGLSSTEVDAALAVATRRQVLGLALVGGVACVERRRAGA